MGKTKNTKFKRPQFSPDGIAVTSAKQSVEEIEDDEDCPAAEFLDKVSCYEFNVLL